MLPKIGDWFIGPLQMESGTLVIFTTKKFLVITEFGGKYETLYDQAGIMVRLEDV
jgi:regulation of enolase protein 1 (concanavalin A-like superfamily)